MNTTLTLDRPERLESRTDLLERFRSRADDVTTPSGSRRRSRATWFWRAAAGSAGNAVGHNAPITASAPTA